MTIHIILGTREKRQERQPRTWEENTIIGSLGLVLLEIQGNGGDYSSMRVYCMKDIEGS